VALQDSFCNWIVEEIGLILNQKVSPPPLLVWCDSNREWLDLLRIAAKDAKFELWANQDENELILRDRFYNTERTPRVVWLPCAREEITWFKVFELEAGCLWEKSLLEALREYGVNISREQESDLIPLLPAYAREWFDKPKSTWKDLALGGAMGALISNDRILEVLAGESGEFDRLKKEGHFQIFTRRAKEDLGLPDPTEMEESKWRVKATARLIATDAAQGSPKNPPSEGENIIPPGPARENALRLLNLWVNHVQFIPSFEKLGREADKLLGLSYWAKNLDEPPRSRSSWAVEETLFNLIADRLDRIEEVELLSKEMEKNLQNLQYRAGGFWSCLASSCIKWPHFVQLAEAASLIVESTGIEKNWKTAKDAVDWYYHQGWMLDQAGESLFLESPDLPKRLQRIRARLRRGYLRKVDQIGCTFSNLLIKGYGEVFCLPTAGELALIELEQTKSPTAIMFVDACSFHLGHRLAAILNKGEPTERASVKVAVAPVPSITPLGMALALPMERKKLRIECAANGKGFSVVAENFDGNLGVASERRRWLSETFGVKDFLTITDVLDSEKLRSPGKGRRFLVVEGGEFDMEGHEGQLKLTGAEEYLERYAQSIRKISRAGYNHIVIVTDHGFFHWQPEVDEIEDSKPDGEMLWLSRRAIVGRNLKHKSAIHLHVPCSDLEAMTPRSINTFKTYGGLGYFHGGATLQELIIPVIIVNWPAKTTKLPIVLKPVGHIASENPRVQLEAGVRGQTSFIPDSTQLTRRVLIKIRETSSGKLIFKHTEPVIIEPSGKPVTVQLQMVEPRPKVPYGSDLEIEVLDADDEEPLVKEKVILKVDIDEW